MGGKYGEGYRCATHMTKVFVKTTILFLQCEVRKPNLQPLATRSSVSYFTIITDHSVTTHPPLSGDTAIIEFISNVI